ncbi:A24 family peptidase [Vibrio cionasavignyae]|uniref:A24 family peptidase n=1 Tax=Vibrio cionasavignyae TaxID=2910252 RepID=UPI003D0A434B
MLIFVMLITSALVCASDVALRKISNIFGVIIFMCSILLLLETKQELTMHFLSLCIVSVIVLTAFGLNILGGGDVKLMLAFSIAIPIHYLGDAIFNVAIVGGMLSILYLVKYRVLRFVPEGGEAGLPYGIAISLGFFSTIYKLYI